MLMGKWLPSLLKALQSFKMSVTIHQLPLHNHPDDLNSNLEVHNDHFMYNDNWLLTPSNRIIDKETEKTGQKKEVTYKMTKQMLYLESFIYTNIPLSSKE